MIVERRTPIHVWSEWPALDLLLAAALGVLSYALWHPFGSIPQVARSGLYTDLGSVLGTVGSLGTIAIGAFSGATGPLTTRLRRDAGRPLQRNFVCILVSPIICAVLCWTGKVLDTLAHDDIASACVIAAGSAGAANLMRQVWLLRGLMRLADTDRVAPALQPRPRRRLTPTSSSTRVEERPEPGAGRITV